MRLFAIGDLHLPGGDEKPMSVFGPQWDRHFLRISEAWRETVREEDAVLIPGDISWAMKLEDALPDLEAIGALPGRKVLIRGNHDYWWSSISRIRSLLPENMYALQNDAVDLGDWVVCGTRGWMIPGMEDGGGEENEKIYAREVNRLALALDCAARIGKGKPTVVMLHYPPRTSQVPASGFSHLLEERGVRLCVYGHLHGNGIQAAFNGTERGVRYMLTSCDSLGFRPIRVDGATEEADRDAGPEADGTPRPSFEPETLRPEDEPR